MELWYLYIVGLSTVSEVFTGYTFSVQIEARKPFCKLFVFKNHFFKWLFGYSGFPLLCRMIFLRTCFSTLCDSYLTRLLHCWKPSRRCWRRRPLPPSRSPPPPPPPPPSCPHPHPTKKAPNSFCHVYLTFEQLTPAVIQHTWVTAAWVRSKQWPVWNWVRRSTTALAGDILETGPSSTNTLEKSCTDTLTGEKDSSIPLLPTWMHLVTLGHMHS